MNKAERLHNLMLFAYRRRQFNLKDVMQNFNVSKSTAMRDILSLQTMGVPLYTDLGKYGGYRVLDTYALPPISFTSAEVQALFFAMQSLKSFESTPFDIEYQTMRDKLSGCLSDSNKTAIAAMEDRVHLHQPKHQNISTSLKSLLDASISQRVVRITYLKHGQKTERHIQPLGLVSREGNWYCPAYDFSAKGYRVFRCDRVVGLQGTDKQPINLSSYTISNEHALKQRGPHAIDFSVRLSDAGAEIFHKNNYPTFSIRSDPSGIYLTGWYEPSEQEFIVNYLLAFGATAYIVAPGSLKLAFRERLRALLETYSHLIDYESPEGQARPTPRSYQLS